jgi:hypothetical protein
MISPKNGDDVAMTQDLQQNMKDPDLCSGGDQPGGIELETHQKE